MKTIYTVLLCTVGTLQLNAQQLLVDSFPTIDLNEVRVNSYYDANSNSNRTKSKDGQARTERLLDGLPGINLIGRGNFAQEPVIRGLSDGQIFVTINGMKIFGACTDRMDPSTSYIEPNNLQSVKLNNGPGFDAGGATIGGSLNFNLKKPELRNDRLLKSSLGAGFETNAAARQFLGSLQYSSKKFALFANGIFRKADNYTTGGDRGRVVSGLGEWRPETGFSVDKKARVLYSQFEKWNAGLSAVFRLNDRETLNADYILDRGRNIGYPALTMDVAFANANIASVGHQYMRNGAIVSEIESKFYFNGINHAMDDTKRPKEQIRMHMDMPGYSWTGGFFSRATINLPHQQMNVKLEKYINRWHADMTMYAGKDAITMYMLTIPDAQRDVSGIDIEDKIHLSGRLNLEAGGRAELNSSHIYTEKGLEQLSVIFNDNVARNRFLYNAYLRTNFIFSPKQNFSFSLAKAARSATLKELYSVYLFNRVDGFEYLGNPALKNENAINIDAGWRYRTKDFYAGLKGFAYFFKDYIVGKSAPGFSPTMSYKGVKRYENLTTAKIAGGEVTLVYSPVQWLSVSSINTYQFGKDAMNSALPMISPFRSTNKIDWRPAESWDVYVESVYAAKQEKVSVYYGESATPAFNIYNAGLVKNFRFDEKELRISATGLNIFNFYYYEHLDVMKLPRPGRNIVLHATLYF